MQTYKEFCVTKDTSNLNEWHKPIDEALIALGRVKNLVKSSSDTYIAVMRCMAALQEYEGLAAPTHATNSFSPTGNGSYDV